MPVVVKVREERNVTVAAGGDRVSDVDRGLDVPFDLLGGERVPIGVGTSDVDIGEHGGRALAGLRETRDERVSVGLTQIEADGGASVLSCCEDRVSAPSEGNDGEMAELCEGVEDRCTEFDWLLARVDARGRAWSIEDVSATTGEARIALPGVEEGLVDAGELLHG